MIDCWRMQIQNSRHKTMTAEQINDVRKRKQYEGLFRVLEVTTYHYQIIRYWNALSFSVWNCQGQTSIARILTVNG